MEQQYMILNGIWKMENKDGTAACMVQIPGSVLSGALEQGWIADPFYRMNEYDVRDFLRQDFTFSRIFSIEKREGYTYELCCDGIDTAAHLFLNGTLLQKADNMHRRYRIVCTDSLKDGRNELKICIQSAIRYIETYVPEQGKEIHYTPNGAMEGNQYIRKAHSMFGWDWGPQLPDMGIWRTISIRGFAQASLEELKIHQKHASGQVEVLADAWIKFPNTEVLSWQQAKEKMPQLNIKIELISPQGDQQAFTDGKCIVQNPKLWWPNRYGGQPLYTVKASLLLDGQLLSEKSYRIGLRTITVSRQEDAWGEEFAFCVNGVKIFAKGANYIPQDCIYSRITSKRTEKLLFAAADCGFNCIRVWGGGYYPEDEFYDICDEKGLIVWQDFMFACNIYELTTKMRQNIVLEVKDNVKRLCHHASLGLWCGNNEIESAWAHWEGFCSHPQALRQDYLEIFETLIPQALRSEDDVTCYWPSSPSSGGAFQNPDYENAGDCHYWDVWHGEKPFSDYRNHYFRFCSEFGFQSFPCMKTIESFALPKELNIFSEVMESHQKNGTANGKILHYLSDTFLYPKDFKSLLYTSQLLQGLAIKEGVEHWRRNRGRCMGAIYWQLNDNWPVASWSSIDYFGRWKALQYMARHFFADILGGLQVSDNGSCYLYIQNETLQDTSSDVQLFVKTMDGQILYETSEQIFCKALSVAEMSPVSVNQVAAKRERDVFIEAVFRHADGSMSHQVRMLKPYKHMHLQKAQITNRWEREGDVLKIYLTSNLPAFFVEVETNVDMVLSDNYMHLTEQKEYAITGNLPGGYEGMVKIAVHSLCDSYE